MTNPDDLANRVSKLEREVARLREQSVLTTTDAGAARVLAAGADRDVGEVRAELRAHIQVLHALRETQLEQGQRMEAGFAALRETQVEQARRTEAGFAVLNTGMGQIATLLQTITEQP